MLLAAASEPVLVMLLFEFVVVVALEPVAVCAAWFCDCHQFE